ncbi:MAG: hypothetical protein JO111_14290 [Caulobacteraceae bacterium]|nr:hypothetical protein [Caulobacteraceae bacterium]
MIVQTLVGAGPEPAHLTTLQVCLGGAAVFGVAILAVRLARRSLSEGAPLYMVLGVILGAGLSQTVGGPSPIIPAMVCAALLALVCRLMGREPFRRVWILLQNLRDDDGGERPAASEPRPQAFRFDGGLGNGQATHVISLGRNGHFSAAPRR